ncbi:nodulation protein NolNO [Lentzea sp. NBRC 105346]|uniref:carbamoyltransferase family protein n=1 Tax=Lentzea sp. NBRC 105346 TaxID=3032205 RepID=UPI0024A3A307|nr:carbamoyltransferase C-terminal domain-containing protein [Lentzea sp. NBRC 105346]GLZ29251.1 nodulation protein NolNO [Lentzea sp. NBRC 105346]
MLVLGLNGNLSAAGADVVPGLSELYLHDAAACLVRDGELVAAVEEERLNRIKKTTKFPAAAIRECLDIAGATPHDVDAVGYYFPESFVDGILHRLYLERPGVPVRYSRELIHERLRADLGWELGDADLRYVPHHLAHGLSTYVRSGMDEALVVIMDGAGERGSITIFHGRGPELTELCTYPIRSSLGLFYLDGTRLLGYGFGDEYKVMGLAPHGDPGVYRGIFETLYTLAPDGRYELSAGMPVINRLAEAFHAAGIPPRRKGEPFSQVHQDIAAALQETTEKIAMHVLRHWARATGLHRLAFGGGVAHNSTLNGRILASGLFDEVFVHPASHDAGSSEGAALAVAWERGDRAWPQPRLRSASLGPGLGDPEPVLKAWSALVDFERPDDIIDTTARLLADGNVVGWAHGRSEFGPRALGNRSILADPRPASNRTRINAMVKKRESFRPFAPVVTAEAAADWFDLPDAVGYHDFMSFVVPVRGSSLGAVTHVDGSARVQVVSAGSRFHRLVARFGELTGTPVLLNTSFNNNAEPIVQSISDVLTCFLTTDLDVLVVEDWVVRKRSLPSLADFVLEFRPVTKLVRCGSAAGVTYEIHLDYATGPRAEVSLGMYELLARADGRTSLGELGFSSTLLPELIELWQQRFFVLRPR